MPAVILESSLIGACLSVIDEILLEMNQTLG